MKKKINFKKSYSKLFLVLFSLSFFLLIFFFLFVSCQNGFCPKKVNSILEKGITGKVIDSSGDFNSVEFLEKKSVILSNFSGDTIAVSGNILAVANGDSISIFEKDSSGNWVKKTTIYRDSVAAEVSSLENKLEVLSNGRPIGEGKFISQGFGKTVSLSGDYLLSGGFVFKRDAQGNWNQEFIQREGYVFYGYETGGPGSSVEPFFFRYIYNPSLSYLDNFNKYFDLKGSSHNDRGFYNARTMDPFFVKFFYEKERFLEGKKYTVGVSQHTWPLYFIKENVFIDGYFGSISRKFGSEIVDPTMYFDNIFLSQTVFIVGDLIVGVGGVYKKNESSGYWERKSDGIKNIFSVSEDLVFTLADGDKNISVYKKNSSDGFDFFYSIPLQVNDDFGNSLSVSNKTLLVGLPKKKYYTYCDSLISYPYTSLFNSFGIVNSMVNSYMGEYKYLSFFKKISYECDVPILFNPMVSNCAGTSAISQQINSNPILFNYVNENRILYLPSCSGVPLPFCAGFTNFLSEDNFGQFEDRYNLTLHPHNLQLIVKVPEDSYKNYIYDSIYFTGKYGELRLARYFVSYLDLIKNPYSGKYSCLDCIGSWKNYALNKHDFNGFMEVLDSFKPSGGWDEVSPIKKPNPSAAYFYIKDSSGKFTNPKKIAPANLEQNERFASSVSISGDYAVIGSTRDVGSSLPGNFYVYKKDNSGNWNLLSKVSSQIVDPSFGKTILIKDNLIFVGSNKNLYTYQLVYRSSDNVPPTLAVSNYSGHYSFGLNLNAFASDESGISSWSLSGSSLFSINQSGNIKNISAVNAGTYFLNVSVLDNEGNIASKIIKVELLSSPVCGDSACMDGETCSNCAYDCGACPNLFLQDYSEPIVVDYSNATEYIKIGYSFYLSEGDSVNFSFENKKYSLFLNEYDSFEFELFSTEGNKNKILTFNLEEEIEKNIDLEGDDDLDLYLFLHLLGEENILELSMHFIDNFYSDSDSSIFSDTEETEEFEDDDENEEEEESSSGNTEVETSQTSSNTSTPAKNSSNKKEEDSFDILPIIILSIVLLFFSIFIIYLFLLKKKEDAEKNKVKNDVSFKDNSLRNSKKNIFPVNKSFLSNKQNLRRNL